MEDNSRRYLFAAVSYLAKKKKLASCKIEQENRKPSSEGLITLSSLSSLPLPQLPPTDKDDKPSKLRNSLSPTTTPPLENDTIMKYLTTSSSSPENRNDFRPLPSPPTQLQIQTNLLIKKGHKEKKVAAAKKHETTKKRKRSEVNKKGKEKVYVRAPARTMPKHMWDLITGMQGIDINWINTKLIYESDIKKNQNRLLLSDPKEVEEVMKEEEIKSVRGSEINMEVHVFDPKLVVRKLNISYWPKARRYALITRWSELAEGNGLKPKSHEVDIWSFRNLLGMLCFAVNFRRIRSEEEDEYLDPKLEDSDDAEEEDSTGGALVQGLVGLARAAGAEGVRTSGNVDTVN